MALTLQELIDNNEAAIEKVQKSQEYRMGSNANRYALLIDLIAVQDRLLSLVTEEGDLSLTQVELKLKNIGGGRNAISFT